MSVEREAAIAEFLKANDLEAKFGQVMQHVIACNPAAVLVFWEDDDGYSAVTVPHSRALAYGLATKAFEILVMPEDEDDSDVSDDDVVDD